MERKNLLPIEPLLPEPRLCLLDVLELFSVPRGENVVNEAEYRGLAATAFTAPPADVGG